MSLAEQFARLPICGRAVPSFHTAPADTEKAPSRSRTVYSVGEAIRRQERNKDAELGASSR